jgi:hypothetical protein
MIQRFLQLSAFVLFSASSGMPREAWPPRMIRRALSAILGVVPQYPPIIASAFASLAKFVRSLSRLFSLGDEWWKKDRC